MSSDIEKHEQLLIALRQAQGTRDGSFEQAVTRAFEHVFDHLGRLNVVSDPKADDRPLKPGESATLR